MTERLYYDLHIHSCLSPCGDNDMTPANIVGMALLKELDVIALTDHNSCGNCAALIEAAQGSPLVVIPGMELCTCEEIHVVCLFPALEQAQAFDTYVASHTPYYQNDPAIYGHQYRMDAGDGILGEESRLLITASDISIEAVPTLMRRFGGICFPAHVDKHSNSLLETLGEFPPSCTFSVAEVSRPTLIDTLCAAHPAMQAMRIVTDSDAHYLWDISERYYALEAPRTASGFLQALITPLTKG